MVFNGSFCLFPATTPYDFLNYLTNDQTSGIPRCMTGNSLTTTTMDAFVYIMIKKSFYSVKLTLFVGS